MQRLIAVLIVLCLAATAPVARAQEPAEQTDAPETPRSEAAEAPADAQPTAAIPTAEIAAKIEESLAELREYRTQIEAAPSVLEIEAQFDPVMTVLESLAARSEMEQLETLSLPRLSDLQQQWEALDVTLARWQATVQSRSRQLEAIRGDLKELEDLWDETADVAVERSFPQELADGILSVSRTVAMVSGELDGRSTELLALQGRIAGLRTRLGAALTEVEAAREQARHRLFAMDSPPLWQAGTTSGRGVTLVESVRQTWDTQRHQYADFFRRNRARLLSQFLFFLLLASLTVVIRVRSSKWQVDASDKAMNATVKIFSRPVSAALLVTLLFTRRFHPQAPNLIYETNLLLVLVPMLRLLGPLVYSHMRPALYGLGALFVLDQLYAIADNSPWLQRWLLLFFTLACLAGVVWLTRPGGFATARGGQRWWRFAIGLGRVATIPLGISLVANIVGNVSLAELLTTGTLLSAYLAVVLFAIVLVLNGLFTVFTRSSFAQQIGSVQRHGELISRRVRSLLNVGALLLWSWAMLVVFRIADPVVHGLAMFLGREWTIGSLQVSLGGILAFLLTVYLSILISRLLRFALEEDVFPRIDLPRGVKPTISMLIHYSVVTLGVLFAVGAAGIPLSQFTIVLGALGVGIGFGLQNVVNNFISGLILVFERPVKVGDTIEAGPLIGVVRRIGIRSSTVRTFDGAEVIIPNGNLVSNNVINWTLSDQLRRVEIPLGVAYGTDPQTVLDLLTQVASRHEDCLKYPEPVALFQGFGDSSLDFLLRFWTAKFDHWMRVRSAVRVEIIAGLNDAGIEIPFPQRDLHLRTVDSTVTEAVKGAASQEPSPALESRRDEH